MNAILLTSLLIATGAAEQAPSPPPVVEASTTPEGTAPAALAENQAHRITLKDGQELRGRISAETPDSVVLELLSGGRVELARASIAKIDTEEVMVGYDGRTWFANPNRTRYLYGPSAMMLRPGECYFSQKELLFSAIGCGVHPNISVLFGTMVPLWFIGGPGGMNAIAAAKVGTPVNDVFHVAAGFEALLLPMSGSPIGAGFVFASGTVGNPNTHLTLSAGRPFAIGFGSGSQASLGDALFVLAADHRLAPNFSLVTENWLMPYLLSRTTPNLFMINSAAVRFLTPRATVDLGVVFMGGLSYPVPWLDFTYNFG